MSTDKVLELMGAAAHTPSIGRAQPGLPPDRRSLSLQVPGESGSLTVRPGEIVGITGNARSCARERAARRGGMSGSLRVSTQIAGMRIRSHPTAMFHHGIAYVSRERDSEWIFDDQPIDFNLTAAIWPLLSRAGFVASRRSPSEHSRYMSPGITSCRWVSSTTVSSTPTARVTRFLFAENAACSGVMSPASIVLPGAASGRG